jgi:hypothetical protein
LGQAIDEASADRIGDCCEHYRQTAADLLQRRHAQGAAGQNDFWRECDQFRRVFAFAVSIVLAPADVDPHISAIDPTQVLKALQESATRACPSRLSAVRFMSTPMRRIRSGCCARAATGHAAAPPSVTMNSRRGIWIAM